MRLDHLLSKEEKSREFLLLSIVWLSMSECTDLEAQMRVSLLTKADVMPKMYMRDCTSEDTQSGFERARPARTEITNLFGGDALRGNTRSHPEHDGKDLSGRWYCTGDGVGE